LSHHLQQTPQIQARDEKLPEILGLQQQQQQEKTAAVSYRNEKEGRFTLNLFRTFQIE